jgi:glyoxylate/succinic semialdehyde reductase
MGKAKFFLGTEGGGANMKLVVNMVMGAMMVAFSEGLALAEKVGGRGRAPAYAPHPGRFAAAAAGVDTPARPRHSPGCRSRM